MSQSIEDIVLSLKSAIADWYTQTNSAQLAFAERLAKVLGADMDVSGALHATGETVGSAMSRASIPFPPAANVLQKSAEIYDALQQSGTLPRDVAQLKDLITYYRAQADALSGACASPMTRSGRNSDAEAITISPSTLA